jgi:hypothetical protein
MLENFNSIMRNGLLELVKDDLGMNRSNLRIVKVKPNSSDKAKPSKTKENLLSLQCLENLECNLTREHTVSEGSEIDSPGNCYRSYKYLKDLSKRLRQAFARMKRARSSVILTQMVDQLDKSVSFVERNDKKRNSNREVRNYNLSFLQLYPCFEEDSFRIDLIKCERY